MPKQENFPNRNEQGPEENFGFEEQAQLNKKYVEKRLEGERESASEIAREVSETQGKKFETTALLSQRRTENPETRIELVNSLNRLIDVLDQQFNFGSPNKPLSDPRVKEITKLIKKITKEIENHYEKHG